jgi:glycosyltransferase involved in cell wall biosynthesis
MEWKYESKLRPVSGSADNPVKILHLISSGGMYGAENVVLSLAQDLQRMGHTARVGIFENYHQPQNDVADQFENRGLSVVRIPCRGRIDRGAIRKIREIVRMESIDVLHAHGYKGDIYGYFAGRRRDLPLVATCHLWTRQTIAIRFYEYIDALFLRRYDAIIAVSDAIAQEARDAGIAPEKITTIDNGIDLSPFASAKPRLAEELKKGDRILVGTVGRLVEQKGMDYFLRAAHKVLQRFPSTLFAIVGDGPDRAKLEKLSRDLKIEASVVFTGTRRDMPSVYASLDIFVLASLDEGMPMAVLEALASGCPTIATEVGAVPKLIMPGQNGLLVPPADSESLAQSICSVLSEPYLRCRMAVNGKEVVDIHFASQVMTSKYLQVYDRALGGTWRQFDPASVARQKT